jgi:hypothetical protein
MGFWERNWNPRRRFSSSGSSSIWRSELVGLEAGFALFEQLEFAVELGILDLLAVFFEALEAFFDHYQVAEDQLGFDIVHVAEGIDGALFVGDGFVGEEAQDVGESVDHAEAGEITGVAQVLLGDGGHVDVFHGGVNHFGGLEEAAQFFQARVRDAGDSGARGGGADAGVRLDAGENGEQRGLADHGQADDGCFHMGNVYRGTSTWLKISSMMRSPASARRCTRVVRVLMTTRWAKSGEASRLTSSGMA